MYKYNTTKILKNDFSMRSHILEVKCFNILFLVKLIIMCGI